MAEDTSQPSPGPGAPASADLAPDALTAELLRRHQAGDKTLTSQEYGKIGAYKSRLYGKAPRGGGLPPAGGLPVASPLAPGQAGPESQMAPDSAGAEDSDPVLVRDTTQAILTALDHVAQRWIQAEAVRAGANDKTALEYVRLVALPPGPKSLMVDTSPAVAQSLGLNAQKYPIAAFIGGLGIWAGSVAAAVMSLNQANGQRARVLASQARPAPAPAPAHTEARGVPQPDPARPAGAPPAVTCEVPPRLPGEVAP